MFTPQTPTPETDAQRCQSLIGHPTNFVHTDFARKLERERNESREMSNHHCEQYAKAALKLTQLRKVCDELANQFYISKTGNNEAHDAYKAYSTLPHVIAAKGT